MSESSGVRLSVPVHGVSGIADLEAAHRRHSLDLTLFPRYLQLRVAPRVRVLVTPGRRHDSSLLALYEDEGGQSEENRFATLQADDAGVPTDSDDFYRAVHAAFAAQAGSDRYIGFTRFGPPPYAPLFALAILYKKYGRGLYRDGELLPVPWPGLSAEYRLRV